MRLLSPLVIVLFCATAARADVIDFEDLGVPIGTQLNPPSGVGVETSGFTVEPGPNNSGGVNDLHLHNQDGFGDNGTTNLGTHDDVVISRLDGDSFSVHSFEFDGFITEAAFFTVSGIKASGTTVSAVFNPDTEPSTRGTPARFELFVLGHEFRNLVSTTWSVPSGFGRNGFFLDNIEFDLGVLMVRIDILPFGVPQQINLRSRRRVAILIYGSPDFDVSAIDPTSLAFGPDDALAQLPIAPDQLRDRDGDGSPDLLARFDVSQAGISAGDDRACVSGVASDAPFHGCAEIQPFAPPNAKTSGVRPTSELDGAATGADPQQ